VKVFYPRYSRSVQVKLVNKLLHVCHHTVESLNEPLLVTTTKEGKVPKLSSRVDRRVYISKGVVRNKLATSTAKEETNVSGTME